MNELPEHLGGHLNKVHTDRGSLLYLKQKYNIESMLDIGCGPGDMVQIANDRGIRTWGIDGDFTIKYPASISPNIIIHDYCDGPSSITREFDLCWSVEFLEHVEEKYLDNYMKDFSRCKYVICTAAPPGQKGHHHVNCRDLSYWKEVFERYGFEYDEEETIEIKKQSNMHKPFIARNGMFYRKKDNE
tara:strand:+ start:6944 stop:7504 length:561 start_codon:yes stop_codon:yes gene_type:complete